MVHILVYNSLNHIGQKKSSPTLGFSAEEDSSVRIESFVIIHLYI